MTFTCVSEILQETWESADDWFQS
ncbi:DinI-like family protein [Symbiopectobacterium sp. RP]